MPLLTVLLTLGGLGCAVLAWCAVGVMVVPRLPGRLAYYGLVAAGRAPALAAGALAGCVLSAAGAARKGRLGWVARIGLGLGAVGAGVLTTMTAATVMFARKHGLSRLTRATLPDSPRFEVVTFANGLDADVYAPEDGGPRRPAMLVIHGGAWTGGDKGENKAWSRWLASRGCVVVDMQYRLAPAANWQESVADIELGLAWVREHAADLRVDPDRVSLLGRSAGGHLALLAAYTTAARPPHRVVALYAPSDLARLYARSRHLCAPLEALARGAPSDVPDAYRLASPIVRAHSGAPPTLLIHGARDDAVPSDHSRQLAHRLDRLGVPRQYLEVPYGRHAFDIDAAGLASQVALEAVSRFCLG